MTRYLDLAEFLWLAEQVTGIDAATLAKASRIDLADSALHAPAGGFGDEDFYPDIFDKAAILCCRLEPPAARRQQARFVGCANSVHRSQRGCLGSRPAGRRPGRGGGHGRGFTPGRRGVVRRLAS